jgi:hypothetical protein
MKFYGPSSDGLSLFFSMTFSSSTRRGRSISDYLGNIISANGIAMDSDKVHAILSWPVPSTIWVMRAFLDLVGYYRRFICDFGAIAALLTRLLRKAPFKWCSEAKKAFRALQRALTSAKVL